MYFDDVSRNSKYTAQWNLQDGYISSSSKNKDESSTMKYAKAKMNALKVAFGKYNEISASTLSQNDGTLPPIFFPTLFFFFPPYSILNDFQIN